MRPDGTAVLYNPRILATAPLACGARSFSLMAKQKVATAGSPAQANSDYIVGAAYWTDLHGSSNLVYGLIDWAWR